MFKHFLLLVILSVLTTAVNAQDETSAQGNSVLYSTNSAPDVLLMPMIDKMFLSNVTHEIGRYNDMDFKEVRSFFKDYISDFTPLSAGSWNVSPVPDSLVKKIHVAQGFDYDLITTPSKKEESQIQKIWNQLQKQQSFTQTKRGVYLENGEIKEFYDGKSRFMNAVVDTAWVFGNVLASSEEDYLLFINELDINKPSPTEANFGSRDRTLKLHFTLYNSKGERVYGNAAFSTFDPEVLDIYEIANSALLSAINRMLAECTNSLNVLSEQN